MSVIICTRNRAEHLKDALESLTAQYLPANVFDVIVVDNGSTDETRQIVRQFQEPGKYPEMHYIFEPTAGLSLARNAGAKAAKGEILAFIDDDELVQPTWISEILACYRRHPDASVVGGRIKIRWPDVRPAWLPEGLEEPYGALDFGDEEREVLWPRFLFGGHISVRRAAFHQVGGFMTSLGRVGNNLMSNEEREFAYRIYEAGGITWYTPHAVVWHKAQAERINPRWVVRRSYWQGISNVVLERVIQPELTRLDLLKRVYWRLCEIRPDVLSLMRWAFGAQNGRTLEDEWRIMLRLGALRQSIVELMRIRGGTRS